MKYLTSSKSTFLLEAPLEVLHSESLEWLEEVEFWKDESAFFYALIIGKTKENPVFETTEAKDIESHLVYLFAEKLDDFKMEVKGHEKFLAKLLESAKMNEQLYRTRHQTISEKMHNFEKEFKEMKKKIFLLAKKAAIK